MNKDKIPDIKGPVKLFVKELNGRYNIHISDSFLEILLANQITYLYHKTNNAILSNIAYNVGCDIFENILEGELRAGSNGHHVAVDLANKFK